MLELLMRIFPHPIRGDICWGCGLLHLKEKGDGGCRFGIRRAKGGGVCRLRGRMGLWFLMRSEVKWWEGCVVCRWGINVGNPFFFFFFFFFPCCVARGWGVEKNIKKKKFTLIKLSSPPPSLLYHLPIRFVKSGKEYQAVMIYGVETVLVYTKKEKRLWRFVISLLYIFFALSFWCYHLSYVRRTGISKAKKKKKKVLFVKGLRDLEL